MEPDDTLLSCGPYEGLISYRVEIKLAGRWYFWGFSPTPTPKTKYRLAQDEVRSEAIFATWGPV